jgi:hypothetical protein
MKFTYRSGERPLEGFTIKRGVGQGGFGEVYFAVSDGGKEVALKLLRGHTDAELRGITHCLNLKHPNLVHLYDLRSDSRGDRWVVMEYVFGESLAQVINRHPNGLPGELIREWFAALARGVAYLHDRGVVHRDLKPANIFIEHGQLKIGDYGLSRRMSGSERGEITRGVGTPHYMAPEIKNGNYGRSIDVYACGVILFEMYTGHPPFDGETPAEVLMKHQLDTPNLRKVPDTIRPILERALEKDPSKRYQSVMEFARAVEEILGGPRSEFAPPVTSPPSLNGKSPAHDTVIDEPRKSPNAIPVARPVIGSGSPGNFRERLTELTGGFTFVPLICLACTAPWALIGGATPWAVLAQVFLLSTTLTWSLLLVARISRQPDKNPWARRSLHLLVGVGVGLLAFWLDGWAVPRGTANASSRDLVLATNHRLSPEALGTAARYLFYFGLAVGACRWWIAADRRRKERVRLWPIVAAAFWSGVFLFLWPWESTPVIVGIAPLVITAVALQAASPWTAPPPPLPVAVRTRPRARPVYA